MFRTATTTGLLAIGAAVLLAGPATAKVPGTNGRIVFDDNDGPIYTANLDGSGLRQIADGHDQAHFSGDGTLVAMDGSDTPDRVSTFIVGADGSNPVFEPLPDATGNAACVTWEPGDQRLACEYWNDADPQQAPGIMTVHRSGWDFFTRVTTNGLGGHDIAGDYSPDGSRIAFLREDPAQGVAVFVVRLSTGAVHRVSGWMRDPHPPSWSPDGRLLLYDDSRGHLMTVRPDGSDEHRLNVAVPARSFMGEPGWSPDGTRIVFQMATRHAQDDWEVGIYTATAAGKDVQRVISGPFAGYSNPDWGPATP